MTKPKRRGAAQHLRQFHQEMTKEEEASEAKDDQGLNNLYWSEQQFKYTLWETWKIKITIFIIGKWDLQMVDFQYPCLITKR